MLIYPSGLTVEYGLSAPGLIVYNEGFTPLWVPVPAPKKIWDFKLRFQPRFDTTEQVIVGTGAAAGTAISLWYLIPAFAFSF